MALFIIQLSTDKYDNGFVKKKTKWKKIIITTVQANFSMAN